MTFGEMQGFTKRFKEIIQSGASNESKTERLSVMMTDMEGAYSIPMLKNERFENENREVMQLYRAVADARTF
ncbi:hypothetical protein [Sporosarcina sp. FSL K6-1508]|uniref:hypothetical protein n=1 Tax=Sporosarcina sp. FSL K6-1508 TaxID=2921553 RepID=UPI0030FA273C